MRAIAMVNHGGPEVLTRVERPTPSPGPGELRVQIHACGLNHLDLWVRGGLPGLHLPMPHILGGDIAGVVESTGEGVLSLKGGDRVVLNPGFSCGNCQACLGGQDNLCARYGLLGEHRPGGNAEWIVVPERQAVPLPDALSFEEAAALPVAGITAWQMVSRRAQVKPGERVLVQAGASGVGLALIQLAKLFGGRVFATASSPAKRAALEALGVEAALDSAAPNLAAELKNLTGGQGVDVVFEHVGIATWDQSVRSLKRGGRLVTCGATTGFEAHLDLRVLFWKQLSILGSTMGSKADLHAVVDAAARGQLRAILDRVLPIDAVREGHERLKSRAHFGKIVFSLAAGGWS